MKKYISIMFLQYSILLLIPNLINARIQVDVVASENENENRVDAIGQDIQIITDEEIKSFGLTDSKLKKAVEDYIGKRPTNAYLRSPTPWGDLYKTNGWPQVTRILKPVKAWVTESKSQPTILSRQVFENKNSVPAKFTATMHQQVEETTESSWHAEHRLSVSQSIQYGFNFVVASGEGTTSFSYEHEWGVSGTKSKTTTVGTESGVQITLQPNETAWALLVATRGYVTVQVQYEASLTGDTVVNYEKPYKDHHFWALGINGVMNAGGITKTLSSTETIKIGYYTDSNVTIVDSLDYMETWTRQNLAGVKMAATNFAQRSINNLRNKKYVNSLK